jgi:predicted ABC-type ATPase
MGAGKTTFAREYLPKFEGCPKFVNVDLIASGLSPFDPQAAALEAGRLMLKQIHAMAARRFHFAFETTLSDKGYVRLFRELKRKGYRIHLVFLWLPSVDMAIKRVQDRIKQGGHSVAEPDIRRRFSRGIENFFGIYGNVVDTWTLFDNSETKPKTIAFGGSGKLRIENRILFEKIMPGTGEK